MSIQPRVENNKLPFNIYEEKENERDTWQIGKVSLLVLFAFPKVRERAQECSRERGERERERERERENFNYIPKEIGYCVIVGCWCWMFAVEMSKS